MGRVLDMKIKKCSVISVAVLSLMTGLSVSKTTAHALQNDWKNDRWVTITRTVYVDKYKLTDPMYKSYVVKTYTIKHGSHYKLSHWGMNFSWALQSGKYNSGAHYAFVPDEKYNDSSWFKSGIHTLKSKPKYKSFHGYRIEIAKYGLNYNTWYDKTIHETISGYKPTDKAKVIFQHGSHLYPTHHSWSRVWGKKDRYVTNYKYSKGAWHQDGATFDTETD